MKTVNIKTRHPIRSLRYPLSGEYVNVKMHEGEILKCLCGNALVEEVLPNGTIVKLNFKNYNKNNCPQEDIQNVETEETEEIVVPKTPPLEMVTEIISDVKVEPEETVEADTVEEETETVEADTVEEETETETVEADTVEEAVVENTVEKNTNNKSKKNKRK